MPKTKLSMRLEKENAWKAELIKEIKGSRAAYGISMADLSMACGLGRTRYPIDQRLKAPERFNLMELKNIFRVLKTDEHTQKSIISGVFGWNA